MECKHEPTVLGTAPKGNLCVVREDSLNGWTVLICPGRTGVRKPLAQFSTLGEAKIFAQNELAKMNATDSTKYVLHVDDCPCWQKQL